ncbi:MAG: 4-hydroxy-tetrahydrodipicolinate synthase [Rickettsiaceae bacterium]|nr:4-hydroxy-tetrahydrodipicolinate synthase [Rickettsiaceae bacterium]
MLGKFLWTACITPFTYDASSVDYKAFEFLLKRQSNAGNGILILGSTGESLSLSLSERQEMVKFVCNLNLSEPIIVGVPSYNIEEAEKWISFCNNMPISGYLLTTPIYTKPGIIGQTKWFERLMDFSNYPVMLYNIPSRAGINLYPETLKNLISHEKLSALKDSSGSVESLIAYKNVAPDLVVYCDDDYLFLEMCINGSKGLVSVSANIWPEAIKLHTKEILENNPTEIKAFWQASKSLFTASNPIPAKALMHKLGLISNPSVRLPLSNEDLPSLEPLLEANFNIESWFAANSKDF